MLSKITVAPFSKIGAIKFAALPIIDKSGLLLFVVGVGTVIIKKFGLYFLICVQIDL